MENARRVVFNYGSESIPDEGDIVFNQPIPEIGQIVMRNGKQWKVRDAIERYPLSSNEPLLFLYLSAVE
jgi:hypothetical protein